MSNPLIYLLVLLVGILVVGIVAVLSRYTREIKAARARLDGLGSRVIETASGPIEYLRVGQGYPVLVVHGAMGGFDQGLWLAHGFDMLKHQVIAVSRFGYLRTPVPAGANLDLQADAFDSLLDALQIRQAAVFAVSAGSTSAIRFTARHPQRISALILLSPDAPGSAQFAFPPRIVFDTLMRSDFIYWVMVTFFSKSLKNSMGLVPRGYVLSPQYEALIKQIQLGDLPVSRRIDGMMFESYNLAADFNASVTAASPYPLGKIATPVLVIHAVDDPISIAENVRGLANLMPNARTFTAPDGGHLLFGHTDEVKAEIAQFLSRNVAELNDDR